MQRVRPAFTIVELLIVVAVIGVLTTIGFVGFARYQADARDNERVSKATILSEALEKYYDEHGEYPSCKSITQAPTTVTTTVLPGVEAQTLKAPQDTSTNSIQCADLTIATPGDFFSYTGDNSSTCTNTSTGVACSLYRIKYKEESTGTIKTIESRRKTALSATDVPSLGAFTGISFTQISGSWTEISGALSYDIQYSTASDFSASPTIANETTTSKTLASLAYGTTYYFRVRAIGGAGAGNWSSSLSSSTWSLSAPCNLVGSSPTITQVTFSWCAVTHASSYTMRYDTSGTFSAPTTLTNVTAPKTLSGLTTGTTYYAQFKAINGAYSSPWSATISATAGLGIPNGLAAVAASTTALNVSWNALSGATGYILDRSTVSDFSSSVTSTALTGTSTTASGLIPATTYYFRVRGTIVANSYEGPNSATASGLTNTPNVVLSGAVECAGTYSGRSAFQVRLYLQEVSYNLTANTSNVNWQLYRYAASGGWASYDQTTTWPWSVTITALQSWSGSSNSIYFKTHTAAGATEGISSGSITVPHDVNGNSSIGYSGQDGPGSSVFGTASCSGTYGLSDLR